MRGEKLKLIAELKAGNDRFRAGISNREWNETKLKKLAVHGQKPGVIILSCSDSRVPPELIFDQCFGDLFVVRVAGNMATPEAIASMEFAALKFGSALIVVMGHTQCGAVEATLDHLHHGGVAPSHNLGLLLNRLSVGVKRNLPNYFKEFQRNELVLNATVGHLNETQDEIAKQSPILREKIERQEVGIVTALYDLHSGAVQFSPDILELGRNPDIQAAHA